MKDNSCITYEEFKRTDSYKYFDEAYTKENYWYYIDTMDMRYCADGTILLLFHGNLVDITELYSYIDKCDMESYQMYIDDCKYY